MMKMQFSLDATVSDFMHDVTGMEPYENHFTDVHEIEHRHLDGFIPYTNGGWVLSCISDISMAHSSGSYPDVIEEYIENDLNDALEEYKREYPDAELDEDGFPTDMDSYAEFEHDYMCEGGTFAYQLKVYYRLASNYRNETGEDEVVIIAGTNTDFEYMRDCGLHVTYSEVFKASELDEDKVRDIMQSALNSI